MNAFLPSNGPDFPRNIHAQSLPNPVHEAYSMYSMPGRPVSGAASPSQHRDSSHNSLSGSYGPASTPHLAHLCPSDQLSSDNRDNGISDMGPPKKPRKRKVPTLRADAWEPYKARILELHKARKKPLREVKEILERECGFSAEYVSPQARESRLHVTGTLS